MIYVFDNQNIFKYKRKELTYLLQRNDWTKAGGYCGCRVEACLKFVSGDTVVISVTGTPAGENIYLKLYKIIKHSIYLFLNILDTQT